MQLLASFRRLGSVLRGVLAPGPFVAVAAALMQAVCGRIVGERTCGLGWRCRWCERVGGRGALAGATCAPPLALLAPLAPAPCLAPCPWTQPPALPPRCSRR